MYCLVNPQKSSMDVIAAFEAQVQQELLALNRDNSTDSSRASVVPASEDCKSGEQAVKLGATYNVFDGEELLEASIASLRPLVQYVCVIYQTVSNFGSRNPELKKTLKDLKARGIVDEIVQYTPSTFTAAQRKELVSPRATGMDLGGASAVEIADQFFNELLKREQGKALCAEAGCTHFMSLDTDEFYDQAQLSSAFERFVKGNYDTGVCKMQMYYRDPRWQLQPPDEMNYVPVFHRLHPSFVYRVGCPFPFVVDPTRKLHNAVRILEYTREELEMHHFSFVRANIGRKLENVSNRGNYTVSSIGEFAAAFEAWNPSKPLMKPNPYFNEVFKRVAIVDNKFNITVGLTSYTGPAAASSVAASSIVEATRCANCGGPGTVRCSKCKKVRYCSAECQQKHWKTGHKSACQST